MEKRPVRPYMSCDMKLGGRGEGDRRDAEVREQKRWDRGRGPWPVRSAALRSRFVVILDAKG